MLSRTIHVDGSAPGGTIDGDSWATAYTDLRAALTAAVAGDRVVVANGTYRPTTTTDRTISFALKSGVEVLGGYAGFGAPNPDARDLALHATILSGDIGAAGVTTDNTQHVVVASGTNATAILDGFTIRDGDATNAGGGAGLYNVGGSPTVRNCTFTNHRYGFGTGGAVLNTNSSSPTFTDCTFTANVAAIGAAVGNTVLSPVSFTRCTFSNNTTTSTGIGDGIAIYSSDRSPVTIHDCTFTNNISKGSGGAVYCSNRSPATITDSVFTGNTCESFGGAVHLSGSLGGSSTITGCTFELNASDLNGGALYVSVHTVSVSNCTFTRNHASEGGAILNQISGSTYTNCTFIANSAGRGGAIHQSSSSPTIAPPPRFINCRFYANDSTNEGGAIYYGGYDSITVNCLFAGNSARYGGAAYIWAAYPALANCTFIANQAEFQGGAVYQYDSQGGLANCIIWDNTAPEGSNVYFHAVGSTTITHSDVQGGHGGAGNINADPQFVREPSIGPDATWGTPDDDYGDLRVTTLNSPTVDTGSNSAVPAGVTTDLAGNTRIADSPGVQSPGAIVDMGAYEAGTHLATLDVAAGQTLTLPVGGHTFFADQLTLGDSATLDLKDNDLVVRDSIGSWNGTGYTGVTGLVQSGRIVTTMTHIGDSTIRALAVADAALLLGISESETATWNGATVDATCVLIKYTYAGDVDLNGEINGDDYFYIDSHILQSGTAFGYSNGDINLDGEINGDDYFWLDSQIISQGLPL